MSKDIAFPGWMQDFMGGHVSVAATIGLSSVRSNPRGYEPAIAPGPAQGPYLYDAIGSVLLFVCGDIGDGVLVANVVSDSLTNRNHVLD